MPSLLLDHPAGPLFCGAVEASSERFVQHQEVRILHDGATKGQPFEFTAGEAERVIVCTPDQIRPGKHLVRVKAPGCSFSPATVEDVL